MHVPNSTSTASTAVSMHVLSLGTLYSDVPAVLHSNNAYIAFIFAGVHQMHMQEPGKLQENKDFLCDHHVLIRGFPPDIIDYLPTNSVLSCQLFATRFSYFEDN
jgi:hypothetical protein